MKRSDLVNPAGEAPLVADQSGLAPEKAGEPGSAADGVTSDLGGVGDQGLDEVLHLVARAPSRAPQQKPTPGMRWGAAGRYVIERLVGAGGMGTVYAATDTLLNRMVALKVLHRAQSVDDDILREARVAALVEHERIARIYDVGAHDGSLFLAMEFVQGRTLREWIRPVEPGPSLQSVRLRVGPRHLRQIVIGIAEGLAVLHGRGVVHGDLKPENVLIVGGLGIKLLDFGLARHCIDSLESTLRPCSPSNGEGAAPWAGTLGYIAPERFAGGEIRPRVDVFALGVIIYEFMTGVRPFVGDRPMAFLDAMKRDPDFSLATWERYSNLRDLTARMLSPAPDVRFGNGSEVLRALLHEIGPASWRRNAEEGVRLKGAILWVDDEPEKNVQEIIELESVGPTVITARSTAEANIYLSRSEFVAVISDMARGEGPWEGYALLDLMRERGDMTPFFVYSSCDSPEHKHEIARCRGQGCTSSGQELLEWVFWELERRVRYPRT